MKFYPLLIAPCIVSSFGHHKHYRQVLFFSSAPLLHYRIRSVSLFFSSVLAHCYAVVFPLFASFYLLALNAFLSLLCKRDKATRLNAIVSFRLVPFVLLFLLTISNFDTFSYLFFVSKVIHFSAYL